MVKKKYATDLEVIVHGRDYGNGKKVGPYIRLLVYGPGEPIMRRGMGWQYFLYRGGWIARRLYP